MADAEVDVGFLDGDCAEWRIWDGPKMGGRPVWLNPKDLPAPEKLICSCGLPYVQLVQVYSPLEDEEHAFHRCIYVFACVDHRCFKKAGPLVLRTQLPRSNAFLPFDAGDGVPTATFARPTAICPVSGMPCPESEPYACAAAAERASEAEERPACRCEAAEAGYSVTYTFGGCGPDSSLQLPEQEVVLEEEPGEEEEEDGIEEAVQQAMAASGAASAGADDDDELANLTEKDLVEMAGRRAEAADEVLVAFQKRMSRARSQILRRTYAADAEPLWCSSEAQWASDAIPPCGGCGRRRQLEFQIMPQLLYYADVTARAVALKRVPLDFGTISVYACPASCPTGTSEGTGTGTGEEGGEWGAYAVEVGRVQTMGKDTVDDRDSAALVMERRAAEGRAGAAEGAADQQQ